MGKTSVGAEAEIAFAENPSPLDMQSYYDLIFHDVLSGMTPFQKYSSDRELGGEVRNQFIIRDKGYSALLKSYVRITRVRNWFKEAHKWILFWAMIFACVKGYQLINRILDPILASKDVSVIVAAMPVLIASLVSFISAVIAVPLAVVKFLFNTKEDDNITEIIKHTQKHDATGRTWVKPNKSIISPKEKEKTD